MTAVAVALILTGTLLALLAAVGVLRLPDPYLRANAATKASSLGVAFILAGVALRSDTGPALAAVVAVVFLLATGPVAAYVIAAAAARAGVPYWRGTRRGGDADPGAPGPGG